MKRYLVDPGQAGEPVVSVYDALTDERFTTWAALLPADDTEWSH